MSMKLSQFKFNLPKELIAEYPSKNRDESKLMVVHRDTGEIEHKTFKDILDYFDEDDLFVFNDTKVFPARLLGIKEKTNAKIEVFLLREINENTRLWDILVEPARKIRIGNKLYFGENALDFLSDELKNYMENLYQVETGERVFPITKNGMYHEMQRGCKASGVKKIRIHDLRHSHVSMLMEQGVSPIDIANRVGHEAIQITYHYAHSYDTKGKEIANLLEKLEDKENES